MQKDSSVYDVLIVGAGPVGVTLARLLGGSGVRVLLMDREHDVLRQPRAIALDDDGARVLQALGELKELKRSMVRIEQVRLSSPRAGTLALANAAIWRNAHPMLQTFHQPDLEDSLRAGLSLSPSVVWRSGLTLTALSPGPDGVSAQLRGSMGEEGVQARFVVGCDGAGSTVRRLIGSAFVGRRYAEDWLVIDARCDPAPDREVHFFCDPARPGVTMPAPGGGRRWEFMLGPGDDREGMRAPASLRRLLAPWGEAATMEIERAAIYSFSAQIASPMRRGRVLLAGDAAHLSPPFAGQGLMAGLRDVFNLAWKLAAVVRGDASLELLASYEQERLPNVRTMLNLARLLGGVITARGAVSCGVRDLVVHPLARLPGLSRLLATLETKPRTRIKSGFLGPGPSRGPLQAGELLPQGRMRDVPGSGQEGRTALLDDFIGYRWVILGHGVDPQSLLSASQRQWWARLGRCFSLGESIGSADGQLQDLEGDLSHLLPRSSCLIARPDRHIYAVVECGRLGAVLEGLKKRLGAHQPI